MKKILILIALLTVSFISTKAQQKSGIGITGGIAPPISDLQQRVDLGFGFNGTYSYRINEQFRLTAAAGYFKWSTLGLSLIAIPVMLGVKYLYGSGILKPYLSGEIGMFFSTSELEITIPFFGITTLEQNSSKFGGSFGGGVNHPLGTNLGLDINVKFNINPTETNSSHYISLMTGVIYKF